MGDERKAAGLADSARATRAVKAPAPQFYPGRRERASVHRDAPLTDRGQQGKKVGDTKRENLRATHLKVGHYKSGPKSTVKRDWDTGKGGRYNRGRGK